MLSNPNFELDINETIRNLYCIFRPYVAEFPLNACEHCVSNSHQRQIAEKPLDQLSSDDLAFYSFKAITTFGSVNDFKHFLPRIFELVIRDSDFSVDPEIVFGKLPEASWRDWPLAEQRAFEQLLRAMWRNVLESHDSVMPIETCLGAIARVVDDLVEFLQFWSDAMDRSAVAETRVAEFLADVFVSGDDWPFWEESLVQQQQVISWLWDNRTAKLITRTLSKWVQLPEGREYSYVLGKYEQWLTQRLEGN